MVGWARAHLWVVGCAIYVVFMFCIWYFYQFRGDKWFNYIDIVSIFGALFVVFGQMFVGLPADKEEL
jgi:hypothetical protein